jgi:hypothetical protein
MLLSGTDVLTLADLALSTLRLTFWMDQPYDFRTLLQGSQRTAHSAREFEERLDPAQLYQDVVCIKPSSYLLILPRS